MIGERLALARRQVEQDRLEQPLPLERAVGQSLHDLLEQHALVSHVLVDDGDAVVVDRHDERVTKLSERHERLRFWTQLACRPA